MNKRPMVEMRGPLEPEAVRLLRHIPGLVVTAAPPGAAHQRRADAIFRFAGSQAAIRIEAKSRANAATAWQLVHYAQAHPDAPVLLIAEETTEEARDILRRHGIGVVDGLGNVHLELPGLLFHLEGKSRKRQAAGSTPARLSGKAGIIAQALLLDPERAWHVDDLAERATVSKGLAHRVLDRLVRERLMTAEGAGPNRTRRLVDRTALLDLWAEENVERSHRTTGYVLARAPQELISKISDGLAAARIDHALTGAAAASLVAPFVTAVPVAHIWVAAHAVPDAVLEAIHAEPATDGENVLVMQAKDDAPLAFREVVKGTSVVNRFRLYVDLRRDPRRGREQADHLREEVIGF